MLEQKRIRQITEEKESKKNKEKELKFKKLLNGDVDGMVWKKPVKILLEDNVNNIIEQRGCLR